MANATTSTDSDIRALLDSRVHACREKDIDGLMAPQHRQLVRTKRSPLLVVALQTGPRKETWSVHTDARRITTRGGHAAGAHVTGGQTRQLWSR
jgi:hypothetical protein